MLGNLGAVANLAVKNLDTAKKFYKDTVGLTPVAAEGDEVVVFTERQPEAQRLPLAVRTGTNQATAVSWNVGNHVDDVVRDLKAKGVKFGALRSAGYDTAGRHSHRRAPADGLVQGSGRQHPQYRERLERLERFPLLTEWSGRILFFSVTECSQ